MDLTHTDRERELLNDVLEALLESNSGTRTLVTDAVAAILGMSPDPKNGWQYLTHEREPDEDWCGEMDDHCGDAP